MVTKTNIPTIAVINRSKSCTAKIFPNKIWNKSVELFATPIKIIPKAKNELKVIPIAVSLFTTLFRLIKAIINDANNPNASAPKKKLIPRIKDNATPGNTA